MIEIYSALVLVLSSGILFFIVRFIDYVDNYGFVSIPMQKNHPKCKKCHVNLTILKNCNHSIHSRLTPFLASIVFVILFIGGSSFADYMTNQPPIEIPPENLDNWGKEDVFTWGKLFNDWLK